MFSIRSWHKSVVAGLAAATFGTFAGHVSGTPPTDEQLDDAAFAAIANVTTEDFCGEAPLGQMRCFGKRVTSPQVYAPLAPSGLGPPDLRAAYGLPTSGGGGRIVAIVDAYDAPNAESGLATYRSQYGLPACTTANGCFKKVNQNGVVGSYPQANSGWAGEVALDIQMVSAVCPDCKILLVEASSANNADLGAAVNTAARLGAVAISNSYGGSEDSSTVTDDAQYYNHPGILITASSGDSAFAAGASFPSSGAHVLGVGGTSLTRSSSTRGWAEKAWRSGGSGCSRYVTKPSFQTDTGCAKRMVADVSAVGDPATGVAVYDSGWQVVGGTSASAPIVAAVFTLLNLQASTNGFAYANPTAFFDVTSGANGTCSTPYFCTAAAGYDGPTGIGSPNGPALAILGGNPPQPDAGTQPQPDAGTQPQPDAGSTGTPDSGSTGTNDAATGSHDASASDAHAPANDASPQPGVDAGGGGPDTNGDTFNTTPTGCACSAPGTTSPVHGGAALALVAIGAAVIARRRRRG